MSNLLRKMMGYAFMVQAGAEGGAGGGGAGDAGAGGDDKGAAAGEKSFVQSLVDGDGAGDDKGAAGDADADAAAAASQTPEQRALQASEKDVRRPANVPAKFWNTEKGEVNYEAWANSTKELENRMRVVGLPPKTADEYKFDVPEPIKALGVDADPAMTKKFRDEALSMGLTQKQYEAVMGKYYEMIPQIASASENFGDANCV